MSTIKHGHLVGSKLLWMIGDAIKGHLRMIDYAFRYGGDEFVVLLPQTSKENALMVVRRVRDLLVNRIYFTEEKMNIKVTASFGVASFPVDGRTRKELCAKPTKPCTLLRTPPAITSRSPVKESLGEESGDPPIESLVISDS